MDPKRWARIEQLFTAAVELTPAEQERFLDQTCAGDSQLRAAVLDLLQADARAGSFLATPVISEQQALSLADRAIRAAAEDVEAEDDTECLPVDETPLPRLERYQITGLLGKGSMGRVYRAVDRQLDREVALKLLYSDHPHQVRRFQHEARAQARLDHQHICRIYDVGEADERPYIAMQLVEGQPLSSLAGRLTTRQKVELVAQVAQALHTAHHLGVIHRDVKPANIMVEEREDGSLRAVLLDFGIARLVEAEGITITGQVMGTPAFMAPEQVRADAKVDHRADLYSLGATLYTLLAGQQLFTGNHVEILLRVLNEVPPPLRELDPDLPPELETIVGRCLQRAPENRYSSAQALADELQRFLAGELTAAPRTEAWQVLLSRARRHRAVAAVIGMVAVLVLALLAILLARTGARRIAAGATGAATGDSNQVQILRIEGEAPTLTSDGDSVVYVAPGRRELWVVEVRGGEPRCLLSSASTVGCPVVTMDGRWVYFGQGEQEQRSIFRIALSGGEPQRVTGGWSPSVSPDGALISCFDRVDRQTSLQVCRSDGSDRRTLFRFDDTRQPLSSCFTPDGRGVLVSRSGASHRSELLLIDLETGAVEETLSFAVRATEGLQVRSGPDLLQALWCLQPTVGGASEATLGITVMGSHATPVFRPLLPGSEAIRYSFPSLSSDGTRLLVHSEEYEDTLAEIPAAVTGEPSAGVEPIPKSGGWFHARVSPDGSRIAYACGSSLRIYDRGQGKSEHLVSVGDATFNPAWSPDGARIVFAALQEGSTDLWVVSATGERKPWRLTDHTADDYHPCWHPNGSSIIWVSERDGVAGLYRIDLETRSIQQLAATDAAHPAISADGRHLAFTAPVCSVGESGCDSGVWLYRLTPEVTLGPLVWQLDGTSQSWARYTPRFSPDGRWLGFDGPREPAGADIFAVPVEDPAGLSPVRVTAIPFIASTRNWWDWIAADRLVVSLARYQDRVLLVYDAEQWIDRTLSQQSP